MKLTEHFTLHEFEKSATANKYGINNSVPHQYIPVLQQLCQEVLEPFRSFVGGPIIITSGYRYNQQTGNYRTAKHYWLTSEYFSYLMSLPYFHPVEVRPSKLKTQRLV